MKARSYGKMQLGFEPLLIFILALFFLCDTDSNSWVTGQPRAWRLVPQTEKPTLTTHLSETEVW